MKTYKDYSRMDIGTSDISTLVLVGCNSKGLKSKLLHFKENGDYQAYMIPKDVKVGAHYKRVASYNKWMKIYDDDSLALEIEAKEINVYRGGDFGCIIQIID